MALLARLVLVRLMKKPVRYIPTKKTLIFSYLDAEMDDYHRSKGNLDVSESVKVPHFNQNNNENEKEMPKVEDLDAEIDQYMKRTC